VEADTPLRAYHWFWHPNDEASLKSLDELLTTYDETIGRGGQLMLGLAPDRRGLLPDSDVARLKEFGNAVRSRYAHNLDVDHLHTTAEADAALDNNPDTFWSAPAGSHHATLEVDLPKATTFNRTLTMEWLNDGQHVQKYAIEIWDGKAWRRVAGAQAIGHKKIDIFPAVTTSRVRLNIVSSSSEAHIREFELYYVPSVSANGASPAK
jgi:alpha-L-fucosidase